MNTKETKDYIEKFEKLTGFNFVSPCVTWQIFEINGKEIYISLDDVVFTINNKLDKFTIVKRVDSKLVSLKDYYKLMSGI